MSSLKLCDCEDCYQSENESKVFHIDYETQKFLKEHCDYWFNGSFHDICKDCVGQINLDYEDFFIIGKYEDLLINKKYIENPELLK